MRQLASFGSSLHAFSLHVLSPHQRDRAPPLQRTPLKATTRPRRDHHHHRCWSHRRHPHPSHTATSTSVRLVIVHLWEIQLRDPPAAVLAATKCFKALVRVLALSPLCACQCTRFSRANHHTRSVTGRQCKTSVQESAVCFKALLVPMVKVGPEAGCSAFRPSSVTTGTRLTTARLGSSTRLRVHMPSTCPSGRDKML